MADSFIVIDRDASGKTSFHPEPTGAPGRLMTTVEIKHRLMVLVESDLDRFLRSKLLPDDNLEQGLLNMAEFNQPALLETFYEWVVKEFA